MTEWMPKQGEMVFYDVDGCVSGMASFVCMYRDKYLLEDGDGDYLSVNSIKRIVIEKEPEIKIGSVWENENDLCVVIKITGEDVSFFYEEDCVVCQRSKDVFLEYFKLRPDKIGMAPALYKSCDGNYKISKELFTEIPKDPSCKNIRWPATPTSWVIVDKEES